VATSILVAFLAAQHTFAMTADEALNKSKAWFKSGKAWSLDFRVQVFYADSPDINSSSGKLLVADGDRFMLDMMGIRFYSDGESLWQWNMDQNQVLIKAVEDLSSALHPSELLFKYLNCKATGLSEGIQQPEALGPQAGPVQVQRPVHTDGSMAEQEGFLSREVANSRPGKKCLMVQHHQSQGDEESIQRRF
jgi:hypothetical protein